MCSVIPTVRNAALRLQEDRKGRIMGVCSVIQTREPLLYNSIKYLSLKKIWGGNRSVFSDSAFKETLLYDFGRMEKVG